MPLPSFSFPSVILVLVLAVIAPIYGADLFQRGRAGPVRFRLPMASMAEAVGSWRMSTWSWWLLICGVLMVAAAGLGGDLVGALFWGFIMGTALVNIPWYHTRRDRSRWAGCVGAGFGVVGGAMLLVVGVWSLTTGFVPLRSTFLKNIGPPALIVAGAAFGLSGVYQVMEMIRGTVLRERGVELFGITRPWKRVTVDGWSPDEGGGFLLRLKLVSPTLFALKMAADWAAVVPVAAADRPDVESFLAGRGATTPASTAVES